MQVSKRVGRRASTRMAATGTMKAKAMATVAPPPVQVAVVTAAAVAATALTGAPAPRVTSPPHTRLGGGQGCRRRQPHPVHHQPTVAE